MVQRVLIIAFSPFLFYHTIILWRGYQITTPGFELFLPNKNPSSKLPGFQNYCSESA